jgi:hypothetical protein
MPILRAHILLCLYQWKAPYIWNKHFWTLWGKKQLCLQPGSAEKSKHQTGKTVKKNTAENVTLDFVWGCVLQYITQNWINGSKSDNWISQAVPKKPYLCTMCKLKWTCSDYKCRDLTSKFPIVVSGSKYT